MPCMSCTVYNSITSCDWLSAQPRHAADQHYKVLTE